MSDLGDNRDALADQHARDTARLIMLLVDKGKTRSDEPGNVMLPLWISVSEAAELVASWLEEHDRQVQQDWLLDTCVGIVEDAETTLDVTLFDWAQGNLDRAALRHAQTRSIAARAEREDVPTPDEQKSKSHIREDAAEANSEGTRT